MLFIITGKQKLNIGRAKVLIDPKTHFANWIQKRNNEDKINTK